MRYRNAVSSCIAGFIASYALAACLYVIYIDDFSSLCKYEVLGVELDSDSTQLKKAYRSLSLLYHPDKNANKDLSKRRYHQISDAFDTLSNDESRDAYDAQIRHTYRASLLPKSIQTIVSKKVSAPTQALLKKYLIYKPIQMTRDTYEKMSLELLLTIACILCTFSFLIKLILRMIRTLYDSTRYVKRDGSVDDYVSVRDSALIHARSRQQESLTSVVMKAKELASQDRISQMRRRELHKEEKAKQEQLRHNQLKKVRENAQEVMHRATRA